MISVDVWMLCKSCPFGKIFIVNNCPFGNLVKFLVVPESYYSYIRW